MMCLISGRPAQFKYPAYIRIPQMILQLPPEPSLKPFHNRLINGLPFIRFPGRKGITELFITFLPETGKYGPPHLIRFLHIRYYFPVFGKQAEITILPHLYISTVMITFQRICIINPGKNSLLGIFTNKYLFHAFGTFPVISDAL